jgi:hypothetical protein
MSSVTSIPGTVVLVSGDRFFLKELTLDSATPAAAQVEIALEESSPFPLAQMYHGFVASADGRRAIAYAAYRRRFTPEETAEWPEAAMVLPDFLALLGPVPGSASIVIQPHAGGLNGAAWDGQTNLPVAVMVQAVGEPTEAQIAEMAAELHRRAGLTGADVRRLSGPVGAGLTSEGGVVFRVGGEETCRLPPTAIAAADVRDKEFLETRQREGRRRRGWWTALLAVAALWVLALGVEVATAILGVRNRQDELAVAQHAEEAARIETADAVAKRVEDLTARPERPFEWLAAASAARPRSVQFLRTASRGDRTLEIEAQTADAADAGVYEASLRRLPLVERVETRELRAREGLTSFVMAVKFKPTAATPAKGGAR